MTNSSRPKTVVIGVALIFVFVVIGAIESVGASDSASRLDVIVFGLILALAFAVWSRQSWARFILLFLALVAVTLTLRVAQSHRHASLKSISVFAAQVLMQVAPVIYLFLPPSNAWFRRRIPDKEST